MKMHRNLVVGLLMLALALPSTALPSDTATRTLIEQLWDRTSALVEELRQVVDLRQDIAKAEVVDPDPPSDDPPGGPLTGIGFEIDPAG